jgi:hypothetical protein
LRGDGKRGDCMREGGEDLNLVPLPVAAHADP